MRATQLYAPTLREVPAEAEIASHQLMLRSGMIHKIAAGLYTYMPLSWRVMKKIEEIIREEMDEIGGQEMMMPILHPAEIWLASGRWNVYGAEMWRIQDRNGRNFCLGPTHEEMITWLIKNDIRSYKQLPLRPYQIQNKYRDERRPRFGLMRSREFIMKDMYSFDRDEEGLDISYRLAYDAYSRIFSRCGLNFRPVEADSGAIGGKGSHEFMALAESGEAEILYCDTCDYAASTEIAAVPAEILEKEEMKEIEEILTPDCPTIEAVAEFVGLPASKTVKSMVYDADGEMVLVMIRGDRRINEIKLQNALGCLELVFATEEAMEAKGLPKGYIGPVGVKGIRIVIDEEVAQMSNQLVGANKHNYHMLNVNLGRDYNADIIYDIRMVEEGEVCPRCGGKLQKARGIEVGQVFKLRTKYSASMNANFVDEEGIEHPFVMGCYGIGVGRTMAAVIEQSHDEHGIIWPMAIAPYQVIVVPVNDKDEELIKLSEEMYTELKKAKIETVLDDRKERPGVKFNDADLIGYPIRITLGKKVQTEGLAEIKFRATGEVVALPVAEVVPYVINAVNEALVK
ncbi:MAG: proline--tRNA ligase [Firmicutes bacterium]|nr:proline--tRNA ligase [Bacillota bacterium]